MFGLGVMPVLRGLCLAAALTAVAPPADAQRLPGVSSPQEAAPAIPPDLPPEAVDGLLSRLTDAEIRALLRDELRRRADEHAAANAALAAPREPLDARISGLAETIGTRLAGWANEIANLGARSSEVVARLARATHGLPGMLAASAAVLLAGVLAAAAVGRATAGWRRWLMAPQLADGRRAGYWDRVVRTVALGLVEIAPVAAFDFATVTAAPVVAGALGPMVDYVWIYEVGVVNAWGLIVIARRAFAPEAPAIRISLLSDAAASDIYAVLRRAVQIGAGGWLLAGLSPTLGLGFGPALSTVTVAGTVVAAFLIVKALANTARVRNALAALLLAPDPSPGALARIAVAAAPAALVAYLGIAWAYWAALWIETGQQHLYGPVGTLIVLLVLPILDRLGLGLAQTLLRADTPAARRYRDVLHEGWRALLAIASVFMVAQLWGLDLYALAKGLGAPRWADALFDIAVTLLVARFVWKLILAALHTERYVAGDDDAEHLSASRLDTLVPLFRKLLLVVLSVIVVMIVLSAAGVNIGPLLASAGIVGIAVGFGAQTLVRDIFSGAFFLFDDAFRVGEYIELDEQLRGEVEAISIRSLQLRHHRGPVITVPFGELKHVVNHNRDWVIYKLSFRLDPDTDPDRVKRLVKEVGKELLADPEHGPKFIEPLKSQGVSMIDEDSALVIRVKFKCRPRAQFVLRREVYHRLHRVFAENGLRFARRKVEVVSSSGGDVAGAAGALPDDILAGKPGTPA